MMGEKLDCIIIGWNFRYKKVDYYLMYEHEFTNQSGMNAISPNQWHRIILDARRYEEEKLKAKVDKDEEESRLVEVTLITTEEDTEAPSPIDPDNILGL